MRLLLFDIDGTLLTCGGQAKPHFAAALTEVFGATGDIDRYDFAGKTDPRIVHDLMRGAGFAAEEIAEKLPRMRDSYLDRLERAIDPAGVRVFAGVRDLLERLAGRDDCVLALLTGNWERGAGIKLGAVDLRRYFAFGSFGDGCVDRRSLPPIALERAGGAHRRVFSSADAWIIGDSLLDVDCAAAHGIRCLGVATGRTPAATLAAAGAAAAVDDFANLDEIVELLFAPTEAPGEAAFA